MLDELASGVGEALRQWKSDYPDLVVLTSFASNLSLALIVSAMHSPSLRGTDALPLLLWQQMTKYQFQALLQLIALELDTGYTLIRNASATSFGRRSP